MGTRADCKPSPFRWKLIYTSTSTTLAKEERQKRWEFQEIMANPSRNISWASWRLRSGIRGSCFAHWTAYWGLSTNIFTRRHDTMMCGGPGPGLNWCNSRCAPCGTNALGIAGVWSIKLVFMEAPLLSFLWCLESLLLNCNYASNLLGDIFLLRGFWVASSGRELQPSQRRSKFVQSFWGRSRGRSLEQFKPHTFHIRAKCKEHLRTPGEHLWISCNLRSWGLVLSGWQYMCTSTAPPPIALVKKTANCQVPQCPTLLQCCPNGQECASENRCCPSNANGCDNPDVFCAGAGSVCCGGPTEYVCPAGQQCNMQGGQFCCNPNELKCDGGCGGPDFWSENESRSNNHGVGCPEGSACGIFFFNNF